MVVFSLNLLQIWNSIWQQNYDSSRETDVFFHKYFMFTCSSSIWNRIPPPKQRGCQTEYVIMVIQIQMQISYCLDDAKAWHKDSDDLYQSKDAIMPDWEFPLWR